MDEHCQKCTGVIMSDFELYFGPGLLRNRLLVPDLKKICCFTCMSVLPSCTFVNHVCALYLWRPEESQTPLALEL